MAYFGKIAIHPIPASDWLTFVGRAAIGPVPGWLVVLAGLGFHLSWIVLAIWTWRIEKRYRAPGKLIAIA